MMLAVSAMAILHPYLGIGMAKEKLFVVLCLGDHMQHRIFANSRLSRPMLPERFGF